MTAKTDTWKTFYVVGKTRMGVYGVDHEVWSIQLFQYTRRNNWLRDVEIRYTIILN